MGDFWEADLGRGQGGRWEPLTITKRTTVGELRAQITVSVVEGAVWSDAKR